MLLFVFVDCCLSLLVIVYQRLFVSGSCCAHLEGEYVKTTPSKYSTVLPYCHAYVPCVNLSVCVWESVCVSELDDCVFLCVGCKDRRLLISDFATEPNVPLWIKTITNG